MKKKKYIAPEVKVYNAPLLAPFASSPNNNPWIESRERTHGPGFGEDEEFGSGSGFGSGFSSGSGFGNDSHEGGYWE